MNIQDLIMFAVNASIMLMVLSLAFGTRPEDATYLLRHPRELARSLISMIVVMPVVVVLLWLIFPIHPAVAAALLSVAVAPVPPILPKKQLKAGGRASYAMGLLTASALLSIITVPFTIWLLGICFNINAHVPLSTILKIILSSVLLPLSVGMAIKYVVPAFAERLAQPAMLLANGLLVISFLPLLAHVWPTFVTLIGEGVLLAILAFTLAGLAAGHMLGGPDPDDRTSLALATASRHPAVSMAIIHTNGWYEKEAIAVTLMALVLSGIIALPYLHWRKKPPTYGAPKAV